MRRKLSLCLFLMFLIGMSDLSAQNCQGQFTTFTIGGWGTVCNGGNPGCYRDAHFAQAFPDGLAIGCGDNTLTLTSSQAVEDFLPSGGPSIELVGSYVDPAGAINNTLASQLVAITLAIGFDANDPDFSSNANSFGALRILNGTFAGMTVTEFLEEANKAIGGCATTYSLSDLNAAATAINENYDNGTVDNGFLDCNTFRLYSITVNSNVSCHGFQNGQATVTVIGGVGPYQYTLTDLSQTFEDGASHIFTGLGAGTYTVTVTDANGVIADGNATFTISQPSLITPLTSSHGVSCYGGNDGTVTITDISGGVEPYTIMWFDESSNLTVTGLTAGTYTALIADSIGCSVSVNVVVDQPTLLGYSSSVTHVTCYGANNGVATITATGGTAPYTILWDNNSTSFTRTGLSPHVNYTAVITDAHGCQTNVSVAVTQPAPLALGTVTTQAVCFGGNGTATVTPSGGTAPYSYVWNTTPAQYEATASLPIGTWSVTVSDANGCSISTLVTITQLSCQGFTTVTPGGWGAACSGGNWGCYLASNFASKFPTGLQVGSGTRFLKFTTAAAVKAFLPSGTTPRALNAGTLTNPTAKSYSNVLAGHAIALTLSIGFDANPTFSPSSTPFGSLIISSGVFSGKSVSQLLAIANTFLGGGTTPYTADQINAAMDAVNRNYDNGTVNLGYLSCPCNVVSKIAAADEAPLRTDFTVYPNPVRGNATVEFTLGYASKVTMVIYNMNGQKVNEVYNGSVTNDVQNTISINAAALKAGMYLLKVTTDRESVTKSLLVTE